MLVIGLRYRLQRDRGVVDSSRDEAVNMTGGQRNLRHKHDDGERR
jgi:hypothetical protein